MTGLKTAGIYCPTLTPLDADGGPCIDLLAPHCRWLLEQGCHGVVLFGTTGEAVSFTVNERRAVLESLLAAGIAADSLIVGTGCCAVGDTVALTTHALRSGVCRVLVLPPYYYKGVAETGVVEAYARTIEEIADASLRLYLYRIPQMSGVDIGASVIEQLARRYPHTIAGLKDSSGDWPSIQSLCETFGRSMSVLVGSERFLVDALGAGASGCVTATANVNAKMLRVLFDERTSELQGDAVRIRERYEALSMIAALKMETARRTGDARWRNVRPPLTQMY